MTRLRNFLVLLAAGIKNVWAATANTVSVNEREREHFVPIEMFLDYTQDYRWAGPTMQCICGQRLFLLIGALDPETREIGMRFTEAICCECGALVRMATGADEEVQA